MLCFVFLHQLITLLEETLGFKPGDVDMFKTPYGLQLNWPKKCSEDECQRTEEEWSEDERQRKERERVKKGIRFTVHLKDNQRVGCTRENFRLFKEGGEVI